MLVIPTDRICNVTLRTILKTILHEINVRQVTLYLNKINMTGQWWFCLQDILANDDMKLDNMFIASLVFDIIKVSMVS